MYGRHSRPRIGITRKERVIGETYLDYHKRVRQAGGQPVDLHPRAYTSPEEALAGVSGLVLTGGVDVDPALYGSARHRETEAPDPERDRFESALLRLALERDMPVLAICRGHQLMNVVMGGRLLQHIEDGSHSQPGMPGQRPSAWHAVQLTSDSRLARLLGTQELTVNSRHHQAVLDEMLAPGLRAVGRSPDGVIEALESLSHNWVIGVQWHPEREEVAELFAPLFADFVRAARKTRLEP